MNLIKDMLVLGAVAVGASGAGIIIAFALFFVVDGITPFGLLC